jgi:hypothetical protein
VRAALEHVDDLGVVMQKFARVLARRLAHLLGHHPMMRTLGIGAFVPAGLENALRSCAGTRSRCTTTSTRRGRPVPRPVHRAAADRRGRGDLPHFRILPGSDAAGVGRPPYLLVWQVRLADHGSAGTARGNGRCSERGDDAGTRGPVRPAPGTTRDDTPGPAGSSAGQASATPTNVVSDAHRPARSPDRNRAAASLRSPAARTATGRRPRASLRRGRIRTPRDALTGRRARRRSRGRAR